MSYEYTFVHGPLASPQLVEELASLYSSQYGVWSANAPRGPGKSVKLAPTRLREWLTKDSKIALAKYEGQVIGYAIVVQARIKRYGVISWVTQLVIHEAHRNLDVGKTLLFSMWGFSDHFAWGLITANPYAVRALEKATRRRCVPKRIGDNKRKLKKLGIEQTTYIKEDTVVEVTADRSRIDTEFFLDHSELGEMLANATVSAPWLLGDIQEGWEWFAFTFHDQPEIALSAEEIEQMIEASDQVTKHAYSRMQIALPSQRWARHTSEETKMVVESCGLAPGQSVLDLGCGNGRHALSLASMGLNITAVDYLGRLFREAQEKAERNDLTAIRFIEGDARAVDLHQEFDAVICLYDVIGSYAEQRENGRILGNCARHLKPGATLVLSVMNFELTEYQAKYFFSLREEPQKLADLNPNERMELSGNVFDPDFYMIDRNTEVVYRKEQFSRGNELPVQLIVRDRRYRRVDIERMCREARLEVLWSRFVQSGHWDVPLDAYDQRAKEILVVCRKANATLHGGNN